jgi:hypothetical protein
MNLNDADDDDDEDDDDDDDIVILQASTVSDSMSVVITLFFNHLLYICFLTWCCHLQKIQTIRNKHYA